jgi:hypothetical protein
LVDRRSEAMRFMMIIKADERFEAGHPPDPKLVEAVGKFSVEMQEKGILVANGGLLPSSKGAKIKVSKSKILVTDGPFIETRELIGGFAILEAESREHAIEMGKQFMQLHADTLGADYVGELEVRQMFDPGECGGGKYE